jgi:flagellar protein FlbT
MSLRIELKPGERILVGDCVITNSDHRAHFVVDGRTPILREKDIMTAKSADTPAKRIYLAIQLMYLARDARQHHETYFSLVRDFVQAAPSGWPLIEIINNQILSGDLYKALKSTRKLIKFEQELLTNEGRRTRLRKRGKADRQPA